MEEKEEKLGPELIEEIDFKERVLEAAGPIVVAFMAEWSGPCRMMAPILEGALGERGAKPEVLRVDVDQSPELVQQFEIQGLPTLLSFRDGKKMEMLSGTLSKGDLHRYLDLQLSL